MLYFNTFLLHCFIVILSFGLCCKKYVPDIDGKETFIRDLETPAFSLKSPLDKNNPRPITNYTKRQKVFTAECTCGVPNASLPTNRVIGGNSTLPNEFPFQVALVSVNTRISLCGATLINNFFVLTAAHCVLDEGKGSVVYAGLTKLKNIQVLIHAHKINDRVEIASKKRKTLEQIIKVDKSEGSIRRNIRKTFVHAGYVEGLRVNQTFSYVHDIALILLDEPVPLGGSGKDGIWTSCIPPLDTYNKYENRTGWIIGWGLTNYSDKTSAGRELQKLQTPILDNKRCQILARGTPVSPYFICISKGTEGSRKMDAGIGDSGGPLLMEDENGTNPNQLIQIGVTSFQHNFNPVYIDTEEAYSAYTRISEYLPWIYHHIESEEAKGTRVKWCKTS